MINLKQRMAQHGFESNQDYSFALKAMNADFGDSLACMCILGDSGRRKTAFANALANSQEAIEHILYFDFSAAEEPQPELIAIQNPEDESCEARASMPISAFDRMMSDACAYSEAERTILILDQLQAADFKQHIRLYEFLQTKEWSYQGSSFFANRRKFTLYIISEDNVYHSLQKHSFKVWIGSDNGAGTRYSFRDLRQPSSAQGLIDALYILFNEISAYPTFSEWLKILRDIAHAVRTCEDLQNCLYGWVEHLEHQSLHSVAATELINAQVMPAIEDFVGVEDVAISAPEDL